MGYAEQFQRIAVHSVVRAEVVLARLLLLLAEHHFGLRVWWWFDLLFALYLLAVFKSMRVQLLLLGLWATGRILSLQYSSLAWELSLVEIALLCSLAFKPFKEVAIQNQPTTANWISNPEQEDSYCHQTATEENPVDYSLIERLPKGLIGRPSYQLLLDELQKQ